MEDSIDTLRGRQTAAELAGLDAAVLLTLAAVKALQTKFADKKQETKLVILKAFVHLRSALGKQQPEILALVQAMKLNI